MAAGKVIGKVEVTKGSIKIVDVDGGVREPKYEGFVYENEQVVSNDPNALFQIKFLALPEASAYDGIFRILADGSVIHGRDAMDSIASDEDLSNILETAAGEDVGDLETAAGEEAAEGSSSFTPTNIVAESSVLGFNRGANGELGFGITDFGSVPNYDIGEIAPPAITSPNVVIYDENSTEPVIQITSTAESDVTYSISGIDSDFFNIDSATGLVTFKESPDFENPKDSGGDNEYNTYITVTDAYGNYTTQLLSVSINNVNEPVTAYDDTVSAVEDTILSSTVDLDANDYDVDGDDLSVVAGEFETAQGGTIVIEADGSYTYTPPTNFNGMDSVGYTVTDGEFNDVGTLTINVAPVNDAAVLSSAVENLTETNATLTTGGTLTIADVDSPEVFVAQTDTNGEYGKFSISAAGVWSYTANEAYNSLNVGDAISDVFQVSSADGTLTTVQITITGTNDAATVSSASVVGTETDAPLTISGTLTSEDVDNADNAFIASSATGTYGDFSIDADGKWTFVANSAFDELNVGASYNETFNVESIDGTVSTVAIQINGTNDAATVSSASVVGTETDAPLTISGTLTSEDVDNADNAFIASSATGTYGDFSIDADGKWTFVANSAFDELNVGASYNETFNVESIDGTVSTVAIQINGTNDAATVSSASVVGTETDAPLTISGTLTSEDVDNADNAFIASSATGTYGDFSIDADGKWTFVANSAFDELNVGASYNETFNVESIDGTVSTVAIQINGTNDAATVSSASVVGTETDAPLTISGTLTSEDVDNADNAFIASSATGTYGDFSIDADGKWTFVANSAFDELNVGASYNETFNVESIDGTVSTVAIQINGTNDAATVSSASVVGTETDAPLTISGTLTSEDVDNADNAFIASSATGTYGDFSIDADGKWTFVANSAFDELNVGASYNETFNVESIDGTVSTVAIQINGTDDYPTITVTTAPSGIVEDSATQDTVVASFAADDVDSDNSAMTYEITSGTDPDGYYVIDGSDVKLTAAGVAHVNGGGDLYDISVTVSSAGLDATGLDSAPDITPAADPLIVYDGLGTIGEPLFDLADFELGDDPDFINGESTEYSSNGLVLSSNLPLNLNFGHGIGIDDPDLGTGDEAINIDMGEELSIELPSSVFGLNMDVKGTTADLIEIKLYDADGEITSGITFKDSDGNLLSLTAEGYIVGNNLSNTDTIVITSDVKFDTLDINNVSPSSGGQGGFTIINVYDPLSIGDGYYSYDYDMSLILQEADEAVDSVTVSGFDDTTTKLVFTYGDSTQVEFESDGDGAIIVDDADLLADVVNGDVVVTIAAQSEIPDGFQPTFDAVTIESESGIPVAHTILGGTADDILSGEDGNDYIDGREGSDTVYGGAGNDDIEYDAFDTEIDGGVGFDTVIGSSEIINLSNVSNIDVIQLNSGTSVVGNGADLGINADDVLSATDNGTLIIQSADSDPLNQVNVDTDSLVLQSESVNIDGINYAEYIGDGGATLLIELNDNITVE